MKAHDPTEPPPVPSSYYELRCAVVEMFHETMLAEGYTIGQAAGRCLVEFRQEIVAGGQDALVALSVILSRVARHDAPALARCVPEVAMLQQLAGRHDWGRDLSPGELSRLREDLNYLNERVPPAT